MTDNKVKLDIFGHTYNIKGDASPEYILKLGEYINDKMNEIGSNISNSNPTQVAILAALNIADEYFQLKELKGGSDDRIEEKTQMLISMLDEGIIGDIFSRVDAIAGD